MAKTNIKLNLKGVNGNAFAIMGATQKALRNGGKKELVTPYLEEAMSGNYDKLLRVTMEYVEVTFE